MLYLIYILTPFFFFFFFFFFFDFFKSEEQILVHFDCFYIFFL